MTRNPTSITPYRGNILGGTVRAEVAVDDVRPFAELRKTVNDVQRILSVHRWAFLVPFCMVSSAAFLLSLYYPRTYQATTTFERRNDPIMVDLPHAAGAASFRYFRSTMERDLTSVAYMAEAVENLGLLRDAPRHADGALTSEGERRRAALARELGSAIAIHTTSPNEHVDIIKLTYTGPDPRIGARLLDEVKKTYIRRTMAWVRAFLESQRDYFAQALVDAGHVLKQAQNEQTRLRLESPHINPDNPGEVSLRMESLELERRELELRRRDHDAELQSLRQMLATAVPIPDSSRSADDLGDPSVVENHPAVLHALEQLRKVDREIEHLRATRGVTDEHPEMKYLMAQRRTAETELNHLREGQRGSSRHADATPAGAAPSPPLMGERSRLAIQIATQEARIRDIDISLTANEMAMEELRSAKTGIYGKMEQYADIMANVSKARQRHREVLETLGKIEPAIQAIEQGRVLQFNQGEPARGSIIPVNPKATTIILLALLAGLGAGVVFVMLAEILDSVYHNSTQVARSLGLPILETIDLIVTTRDRRRLLLQRAVLSPLMLAAFLFLATFSGVVAYVNIERPWTYQRIIAIPQSAAKLFAGSSTPAPQQVASVSG